MELARVTRHWRPERPEDVSETPDGIAIPMTAYVIAAERRGAGAAGPDR